MEPKNVIAAISLSAAVIILYGLFFAPDPQEIKKIQEEKKEIVQNSEAPSLEQNQEFSKITREEAIRESERIVFENDNIKGSLALNGGIIDDLIFKKYTKTLNGKDNVVLLNPRKTKNGYYVETGWATNNKNIDVPTSETKWKFIGNNKLTPNTPIKLFWINDQGIKFEKNISIDEKFLFNIEQKSKCSYKISYYVQGESFLTRSNKTTKMIQNTIKKITKIKTKISTTGGTSDARFIRKISPCIEFGLVGAKKKGGMHKVDESVSISDLKKLTIIYQKILENYFK